MKQENLNKNSSSLWLRLADTVEIFLNDQYEYRLRKGIWSFEEAVLDIEFTSQYVRDVMMSILGKLKQNVLVDVTQACEGTDLTDEELGQISDIFTELKSGNYLVGDEASASIKSIVEEVLGNDVETYLDSGSIDTNKPILFFSDSQSIIDYAKKTMEESGVDIEILPLEELNLISELDLTTKYQAYDTKLAEESVVKRLNGYSCIVGCLERPRVSLLRNLNRAALEISLPFVLSMVDGPFSSIMVLKAPETGCFECFETRLKSRLEDRVIYSEYVNQIKNVSLGHSSAASKIMLSGLASQALFEGILLQRTNQSRLAGRLQSTYLPLLEVQMQDVLRVPFCPACGFVSKSHMEEMYTSIEDIVDKFSSRVTLTPG